MIETMASGDGTPCVEEIMATQSLPPKATTEVYPWEDQHSVDSDGDLCVIEEDSRDSSSGHSDEFMPTKASGSKLSTPRQRPFAAQPALKIHLHKSSPSPVPTAPAPHTPTTAEPGVGQAPSRARGQPQSWRKAVDGKSRKRGQRNENDDDDAAEQAAASAKTTRMQRKSAEGEDIGEGEEADKERTPPAAPLPAGPKGEDRRSLSALGNTRCAEEEEETRCPLCDKTFQLPDQLTSHLKLHALRYRCLPCEKGFGSKSGYYTHQRVHKRGRAFRCSRCPVGFYTKSHLMVHGRLHTGERPFPCPQCPKRFITSSCIKRHMLCHNGVKPYRCPQCSKDFSQNGNLKKHMTTHQLLA